MLFRAGLCPHPTQLGQGPPAGLGSGQVGTRWVPTSTILKALTKSRKWPQGPIRLHVTHQQVQYHGSDLGFHQIVFILIL